MCQKPLPALSNSAVMSATIDLFLLSGILICTLRNIMRCTDAREASPSTRLPDEPLAKFVPLVPLLVVASYKGGVWKTSLTVAIAERLAWAGLRVLLITSDTQEDARARLGVKRSEPLVTSRAYGDAGTVTVAGFRGSTVIDLLYRVGPGKLGIGTFDIVVLDTPPEVQGGSLPGVLLVCPMDGMDAVRNLLTMLGRTPENTDIVLVQV